MPVENMDELSKEVYEENKQLKQQLEESNNKIIELETKLAEYKNNNKSNEMSEINDHMKKIDSQIEDLSTKILYFTTYYELKQREDFIQNISNRLDELENKTKFEEKVELKEPKTIEKIEETKEEAVEEEVPVVNEEQEDIQINEEEEILEVPQENEEKEEKDEEVSILDEELEKLEEEETLEETTNEDAPATLGDGSILVTDKEEVDDLLLSNAMKIISQDNFVDNVAKGVAQPAQESTTEQTQTEVQAPVVNNTIEEVNTEETLSEPQQVVQSEVIQEQPVVQEAEPEVVEQNNTSMYESKNIKALKTCVTNIHNIDPRFQTNKEADLIEMPANIVENFTNNIQLNIPVINADNQGMARSA